MSSRVNDVSVTNTKCRAAKNESTSSSVQWADILATQFIDVEAESESARWRTMVTSSQKKTLHSLLAAKLSSLTIPPSSSPSSSSPPQDFDFNEIFGPTATTPNDSSTSAAASFPPPPLIIHNRSHSFVGPSPRFTPTPSSLPFTSEFLGSQSDDDESETPTGTENRNGGESEKTELGARKFGPADFEMLRVVGQGAFGKVFQVRKKSDGDSNGDGDGGDGLFAMKVMRKDTIIKKNHVDYMKAERDILTKVVHPFIVQLRYSFQVLFF